MKKAVVVYQLRRIYWTVYISKYQINSKTEGDTRLLIQNEIVSCLSDCPDHWDWPC